jgi:CheY-like chemotaxis protein
VAADTCVYIVDDDEAVRDSLSFLLESNGYAVKSFGSALDFLAAAPALPIGRLIVDIRMPEMDGLEPQERLTALALGFPMIVITGHADVPPAVRPTLAVAAFVNHLNVIAWNPFLPFIAEAHGIGVAALGQLPALLLVLSALLGLVVGPLADSYGYRPTMVLCLWAVACSRVDLASRRVADPGAAVFAGAVACRASSVSAFLNPPNSLLSWENTGKFIDFGLRHPNFPSKARVRSAADMTNSLRYGAGN